MKKLFVSLLSAATWLMSGSPAKAALFVSGDSNLIDPLTGIDNGVPGTDTGNQQFFLNILGGGDSVAVLQSSLRYSGGSASQSVNAVNQFYNSIAGRSSIVISGTISSLAGYNLLVVPLPDHAFTSSEIALLGEFLSRGNSVFFLGENNNSDFTAANAIINSDLAALGSSMHIIPDLMDSGWNTATGSRIATDPYTADVNHLTYAAPSRVSGGNYLFWGTGEQPFVTYSPVPEPSTRLLLASGFLGAIGLGRKLRK